MEKMNNTNETRHPVFERCGEMAWMCEDLAKKLVEIAEMRGQNLSDAVTNVNGEGKLTNTVVIRRSSDLVI